MIVIFVEMDRNKDDVKILLLLLLLLLLSSLRHLYNCNIETVLIKFLLLVKIQCSMYICMYVFVYALCLLVC